MPEEQLPEHRQRHEEPPGASTVTSLLSAALAQLCVQNQIAARSWPMLPTSST